MFSAIKKKYPKLIAFRTIVMMIGSIRIVSTNACPALFDLGLLIRPTSYHLDCRSNRGPRSRRLFFASFIDFAFNAFARIFVTQRQLVQQTMQVASADSQLHCRFRAIAVVL